MNQPFIENKLATRVVSGITAYSDYYLIATEGAGIIKYQPKSNDFSQLSSKQKSQLKSDNIKAMLVDDDFLWIGGYNGGLQCYDLKNSVFKYNNTLVNQLMGMSVYGIAKPNNEDFWVGTFGDGVFYEDLQTGDVIQFLKEDENQRLALTDNRVRTIFGRK